MAPVVSNDVKTGTQNPSTATNVVNSSHRGSSGLFSSLMDQKRNSSDAAAQARRASFHDMKPTPGFLGKMWQSFTMGSNSPRK
ncbi:hypothetical protein K3495_g3117 [Podosphaera aphanis]|nr:hypothetical protein K3495_g3117 [Podosphaera aphanis]